MSAHSQAGAVAWQVRYLDEVEGPGDWRPTEEEHVELYRRRGDRYEIRALYSFQSAAVPVEALEGLVTDMKTAANGTSDHYEARWLRLFARRLTTLIKERSNGAP